jgi:hypothetical protein
MERAYILFWIHVEGDQNAEKILTWGKGEQVLAKSGVGAAVIVDRYGEGTPILEQRPEGRT